MVRRPRRKKRRYKTGTHESAKLPTGTCVYRSGWELKLMQWFDACDNVISYQYEPFSIEYISNVKSKRIRHYFPDLLVKFSDDSSVLIEVKPQRKLTNKIVMKKLEAAREWCQRHQVALRVITEVELKLLQLI